MNHCNWHSKTSAEVLEEFSSTAQGLASAEATKKLSIYGKNEIEIQKRFSILMRFLRQFHNTLIYVLLISAIITLSFGHVVDSSIIFAVIITNANFRRYTRRQS